MGASTRALDRAAWLTAKALRDAGDEFRERRLALALSQAHVAMACGMARDHYGRIEHGRARNLSIAQLHRIAAMLGLAPSLRLYPDGVPVRDIGQASRLARFLGWARPPLAKRVEVSLPSVEGRAERRAWDAVIFDGSRRCAVELEMRLRDVQASLRRIDLKRRDDPTEAFLLLIADTRLNRRVIAEFESLFADLPRLRSGLVRASLEAGRLPPTGSCSSRAATSPPHRRPGPRLVSPR
jgi:transcriptional regulator with XRE-family HTH domain